MIFGSYDGSKCLEMQMGSQLDTRSMVLVILYAIPETTTIVKMNTLEETTM